jgi:hypothetical protein
MNEPSLGAKLKEQLDQWNKDLDHLERMIANEKINSPDFMFFSGQHAALVQICLVLSEVLYGNKDITDSSDPRKEQDL